MSRVIANTAVVVENGMDVVVEAETRLVKAEVTHMAVAKETFMEAVVMAEAVVHHLNHKTQPNPCAIDVVWIIIGPRHVGLPNISLTSTKRV